MKNPTAIITTQHKEITIDQPKELSNISTVQTPFKPTSAMKLWVATSADLMTNNISLISKECGIDRTSWYKWLKRDGFIEWLGTEKERYKVLLQMKLDNIGVKKSKESFEYFKLMQKIAGRDVSTEAPASQPPSNPTQINFNTNKYIKNTK